MEKEKCAENGVPREVPTFAQNSEIPPILALREDEKRPERSLALGVVGGQGQN